MISRAGALQFSCSRTGGVGRPYSPTTRATVGEVPFDWGVDLIVRSRFGHRVVIDRKQSRGGFFPVTPSRDALGGVTEDQEQRGTEFAPGNESTLRGQRSGGLALMNALPFVAH